MSWKVDKARLQLSIGSVDFIKGFFEAAQNWPGWNEGQLCQWCVKWACALFKELQSLTSEQREKINMYQRRESLARVNSLKRHSPSASFSLSAKRPSESSQGRRGSGVDNQAEPILPVHPPNQLKLDEAPLQVEVDTNSNVYNTMRLLTPKPYRTSEAEENGPIS